MANIELELAEISAVRGTLEPTINFDFRVKDFNPENVGGRSTLVDVDIKGHIKSGSHSGLELPDFSVDVPINQSRLDRVDSLQAKLTLTNRSLEKIEEMRHQYNEDLELDLDLEFVAQGHNNGNVLRDRGSCSVTVREFEWVNVLEELDFNDIRVMELEFRGDPQSNAALENAHAEIERAQRQRNDGDYKGAIASCRDAIESMEQIDDELLNDAFDDKKLSSAEKLLQTFRKQYLGKFKHSEDKIQIEPALPQDSDFAIGITKSFLTYYSKALEQHADSE